MGAASTPASSPVRRAERCADGDHTAGLKDRELVAERLLKTSRRHSFDPDSEVRWDEPLDPDKFYLPPHTLSLYETPMWDALSHREQVELSKHEMSSVAYQGIWFEMILMQVLLRYSYTADLTSRHVQYALTEIADECRHSKMFGDLVRKLETPVYRPSAQMMVEGHFLKTFGPRVSGFAGALIVEEILDSVQRITFPDEQLQPVIRDVTRIHVIEEARHVKYAREELRRIAPRLNPARREAARWIVARAVHLVLRNLVHPQAYAAVGLDPKAARAASLANPHRRATGAWATRKLRDFLDEVGLMGGPSLALWRHVGAIE
ncbi:MAG: diiron oxygenase [Streptosporangiales bacterium]|nr:diiron oxygenase [Streptosporangiales bacterium]